MNDNFLKFGCRQDALNALSAFGMASDGVFVQATDHFAVDPVGIIYKPTGVMLTDSSGMEYPERQAVEGFHVNIRMVNGDLPDALLAFCLSPVNPVRQFGGAI